MGYDSGHVTSGIFKKSSSALGSNWRGTLRKQLMEIGGNQISEHSPELIFWKCAESEYGNINCGRFARAIYL